MKIIAHRGKLNDYFLENDPQSIWECILRGYDAEVDVWIEKNKISLGHDKPEKEIGMELLKQDAVWCHAKTLDTFIQLSNIYGVKAFFQDEEPIAVTTNGYLWHHKDYPKFTEKSIVAGNSIVGKQPHNIYGIYTDKPTLWNMDLKKPFFKLLAIDVDGIMTRGKVMQQYGQTQAKEFCDLDWTAIKRFKAAHIKVCFVSGDEWNREIAQKRNIDFVHSPAKEGVIDKSKYLDFLCEAYEVEPQEICYIGDDYYDISLLEKVGWAYSPNNSPEAVRSVSVALQRHSGEGLIAELYDLHRENLREAYPYDDL